MRNSDEFFFVACRHSKGDPSEERAQSKVDHSSVLIEKWHRHSFHQNYQAIIVDKITKNFDGRIQFVAGIQTKHDNCQQTGESGAQIR